MNERMRSEGLKIIDAKTVDPYGERVKLHLQHKHWHLAHQVIIDASRELGPGDHGPADVYDWPVSQLPLSTRTVNMLERHGIETVRQLVGITPGHIRSWFSADKRTVEECRKGLASIRDDMTRAVDLWIDCVSHAWKTSIFEDDARKP